MLRTGKYGGVGIQIGLRRDTLTVLTPFEDSPAYNTLECFIPREWLRNGDLLFDSMRSHQDHITQQTGTSLNEYTYCTAPNSEAVGGCVVTSAKKFFEYNGFNPNFKGWGYEDNEIVIRVHRLGHTVTRINDPEALLFHFPHEFDQILE